MGESINWNELLDVLTIEDLKGEPRNIASIIGIEAYKKLVLNYAGTSKLYIHKPDMLVMPIRDELIRREFNGNNIYELAMKWGFSDVYIRQIVREKTKEIKLKPPDGQMSLY